MTQQQIEMVRGTFVRLDAMAGIAALTFYQRLFSLDPSLRPLFRTDIEVQGKKLMQSLRFIVDTLEAPHVMIPVLESLGRRHVIYGVREKHYTTVGLALIEMLEHLLGPAFTGPVRAAWTTAYRFIAETMIQAAAAVVPIESAYNS